MSRRYARVAAGILALCLFLNREALAQAPRYYRVDDLGSLGGQYLVALAINNNGDVAGYGDLADGTLHAFRWTASGKLEDLGWHTRSER
jgi:probable HAF family extracellular repeat protein